MWKRPLHLHVSDVEQTFQRAAFEGQSEVVANLTLWSVTRDEKFGFDLLLFAVRVDDSACYARVILRKAVEGCLPPHVLCVRLDELIQQTLVPALFDD